MEQKKKILTTKLLKKEFNYDDRGNLIIKGYFTSDQKDELGDVITRSATDNAIEKYKRWGNIRYMHSPRPVGKVLRIGEGDGLAWNQVEFKVVPDDVKKEVEEGLLSALSVGIFFGFDDIDIDENTGGWTINNYTLAEISLVDHPANYDAFLTEGLDKEIIREKGVYIMQDLENTQAGTFNDSASGDYTVRVNAETDLIDGSDNSTIGPSLEDNSTIEEAKEVEPEVEKEIEPEVEAEKELETEEVEVEKEIEAEPEAEKEVEAEVEKEIEVEAEKSMEPETEKEVDPEEKSPACRQEGETKDECVSRKIPEIKKENPDMSQDQAIAIAESMCSKSCDDKEIETNEEKTIEVTTTEKGEDRIDALEKKFDLLLDRLNALLDSQESQTVVEERDEEKSIDNETEAKIAELEKTIDELSTPKNRLDNSIETEEVPEETRAEAQEEKIVDPATMTLKEALKKRFNLKD